MVCAAGGGEEALEGNKMNIKRVGEYGQRYKDEFLISDLGVKAQLLGDWHEGLNFFFRKSFYRGRKDEISDVFRERALEVIQEFDLRNNIRKFKPSEFNKLLKQNRVNNRVDRRMICQSIELIKGKGGLNIVSYSVEQIKKDEVAGVYDELCKIYGVADKIATFFLRDLAIVFGLEGKIDEQDYIYFQPIDTWVRQVAERLKIIDERENNADTIKEKIISATLSEGVSPLLFNAGAWYIGKHSFDLLFNNE
ncbi:MAG: hypothetical protein UX85_C0011G0006 [Candidatus Beckwithbacteria bacterium GW2011_GWB1_47_15]|uniref:Uncharacterized protein n=1 Tax=Candidatus Beckwithbacteria bacterium GW2011_GWB1_47_15 TaxID=1618371 RepID=A0A0G1RTK1_9BACT|nr:MAG: hypothetical protein UX50_C0014G0006 [Candidatus Beckwithbacteria bacterium GW2011_GWA1_46_30]KKU60431.1 MAG: hypothetical protein UX85_C0011G0006 [Candidatus Beckwithbacteria bacterium GW2011_GWB1_47_15]KKU71614.1 MAG: hypothetical protein UX97_C0005G0097 [Candidatus Beckwithbacteria bacterium GW2011_GWA2_47_25]OGD48192.1 MAG: hypothetical protein A2877_02880 [Candidatus Beckwithbacteria bacterium RIFCSPHIGHO2_01_FULL_49_39]OGD50189.1 MAG: hypothetical protein A3K56_00635 [Candidatus B